MPVTCSWSAFWPVSWLRSVGWLLTGLLLSWVLAGGARAADAGGSLAGPAAALVVGNRPLSATDLAAHIDRLRDPGAQLTLDAVRGAEPARRFDRPGRVVAEGFSDAAHWLRLRLQRGAEAPERWLLRLDRAYLDEVQLHQVLPDGGVLPLRVAGDSVAPVGAMVLRVPAFELDLSRPGVHELYLRVRSGSTLLLPLTLTPGPEVAPALMREYLQIGLFHGAAVVLLLFSLGAAVWLRERLFLYFSGFILANGLLWFTLFGGLRQFAPAWVAGHTNAWAATTLCLAAALGTLLFIELLQVRAFAPRLGRVLSAAVALYALLALGPLLGSDNQFTPLVLRCMLGVQLLVLWPMWRAWRHGPAPARLTVLILLVSGVLTSANSLLTLGWMPAAPLLVQSGPAAHLVHLAGMAVLVVLRVREIRRRSAAAEALAAEAQRLHAHERAARQDQGHLLAMIAHEVRTPVAIIDAALQSLRLLDEDVTPERARRHDRIERALGRMGDLVEMVLTRDRLDVSSWSCEMVPVEPLQVTRDAVATLGATAESRVVLQAQEPLPRVLADERMLRYALLNLIDNALKYSPGEARVQVRLGPAVQGGRVGCLWTVLDQGAGVAASEQDRIFEKYYRSPRAADTPGLGLGLYLVRQIFERQGGRVRAIPAVAGLPGGCFEAWLPTRSAEPGAPAQAAS